MQHSFSAEAVGLIYGRGKHRARLSRWLRREVQPCVDRHDIMERAVVACLREEGVGNSL